MVTLLLGAALVIAGATLIWMGRRFRVLAQRFRDLDAAFGQVDAELRRIRTELAHVSPATVVLAYLLRRLEFMASMGDPARDQLPELLGALGLSDAVGYDALRGARDDLYKLLPSNLALATERLLTGEVWDDQDAVSPLGSRPPSA